VFFNPTNPERHLLKMPKTWKNALKKAKVSYFPIYSLRATFASRLSAAGNPDNLAAGLLGRSSPAIVHTYAKVLDEYRRDAIKRLEEHRRSHQPPAEDLRAEVVDQ
jgi:integrase